MECQRSEGAASPETHQRASSLLSDMHAQTIGFKQAMRHSTQIDECPSGSMISRQLVTRFGLIAVESLVVRRMLTRPKPK